MKLLFDQNLSPRLVHLLEDLFPYSVHVSTLGLDQAMDREVWDHTGEHGFILVSKDVAFSELSVLYGHPPKLLWLRLGNCTTSQVIAVLRDNYDLIHRMNEDEQLGILTLGWNRDSS